MRAKLNDSRIKESFNGTWFFLFKFSGKKYRQYNFQTREQAEQALQLQYKVLNFFPCGLERKLPVLVESGIFLTPNGKYRANVWRKSDLSYNAKTFSTIEQAREFLALNKPPRKTRVVAPKPVKVVKPPKPPKPVKQIKPKSTTTDQPKPKLPKSEMAALALKSKQNSKIANLTACQLNRGIAELNNRDRTTKRTIPTISELFEIAKTKPNPRQYYLDQLKAEAYRV